MALLGGKNYDPAISVSKVTTAALAMTAIDTANLRIIFTVPPSGNVLVRLRGIVHGATTFPQILLGVLEGATVKGKQVPIGALKTTAVATAELAQEALFVVTGLTPGNSLTWDAAYGVETLVAGTGLKYGGPNDTAGNDAFGGLVFEIWDCPLLLGAKLYDPTTAVSKSTASLLAMTALDTTNLRITFTAPASGNVLVRLRGPVEGATTMPSILLGVLEAAAVVGRQSPIGGLEGTALATTRIAQEASFIITGLAPGSSHTYDAAYAVQVVLGATNIKYGGPDDTTADNAWGGFAFDIWQA